MKLLHLDSSILGQHSASRELGAAVVSRWQRDIPGLEVAYRDLAANPLPHLSGASLAQADADEAATSATVMAEFLATDVLVIGAPMYNFGIPSQLKAWIDRVAVAGKTFRYTAEGPQGLAGGKTVILASSRGGRYAEQPALAGLDHQESYLRTVFGFFGVTDIRIVRAEGVAMGEAAKAQALQAARRQIASVADAAPNEARATEAA
jgi:FMN-dependent NADH-azoreductase